MRRIPTLVDRLTRKRFCASALLSTVAAAPLALANAAAAVAGSAGATTSWLDQVTGTQLITGAAAFFAFAAGLWAVRTTISSRNSTLVWSRRLAEVEARFEKSESILSSHPGLVLVWNDAYNEIDEGWGTPRVLGGPAALAALLTFAPDHAAAFQNPADHLLSALGDLPLESDETPDGQAPTLRDKVYNLRHHGVAFSGSVVTDEGRSIEVDGRVAGDQVTLWLTDPAVRLAEEASVIGQARDKAADLHGALNQLDRAPLAAWRRGPDLKLEWVNRYYVEVVEAINMQEVVDEQLEIDPAFKSVAERAQKESERTRRAVDDIVRVSVKGQRRVLRVIEVPLHGSGGASFGGIAIDVTRQERAQDDLERQRESHRRTLDQVSAAVAVFNAAQNLEYYNSAFVELWGLDDAELRARPSHGEILDRLRHLERLPAQDNFANWKRGQLRLYTEEQADAASAVEGETPDEIWHLPSGKTIRVGQQRHAMGGVSVVFEDITETLNLQRQYQTQISVQRETLNNLAEAVAVFGPDGRLGLFNRAFEAMWSFSREDLTRLPHFDALGRAILSLGPEATKIIENIKRRIVSFAPEDRTLYSGQELSLRDGRTLMSATCPLPDGNTLITFLDVTDSREREKELEVRNQILEDADRIKSRFVDHISYQLRNPLNTIIGFTEMLESEMVGTLNERQKDYASTVLTASNHLLDLVNDIIDLAAIDAGRLGLDVQEVDVAQLLASAANFASLKAEDSQVHLSLDCADGTGSIWVDERRIRQVLFNLLANAFTFTDPGGEVTLGARRDGDAVCIWVADTGRGVSPRDQATVFDRFESAGPGAGAGLGLALVNSYVELHGGFVRLASKEGEGTTVTCHLPVGKPAELRDGTDTAALTAAE